MTERAKSPDDDGIVEVPVILTREEFDIIRTLEAGWEKAWGKLYAALVEHLHLVCDHISDTINWEGYGDAELARLEFIDGLMEKYYDRRVRLGLLLTNQIADSRLVYRLASRNFVTQRAYSFFRTQRPRHYATDDFEHAAPRFAGEAVAFRFHNGEEAAERHEHALTRSDSIFRNLSLNYDLRKTGKAVDAVDETAGLELFPRIAWGNEKMQPLLLHLAYAVGESDGAVVTDDADVFNSMRQTHSQRHDNLCAEFHALTRDLARMKNSEGKGALRKKNAIDAKLLEILLYPLTKEDIVLLLSRTTSEEAVEGRIRRYRENLGRLLSGNRFLYGELQ